MSSVYLREREKMSFRYYEPMNQVGGMLVYQGHSHRRQQQGRGFIGDAFKRIALPIGKSLAQQGLKIGKDLGKRGVRAGVGALKDRLRGGTSMKEAFKRRATAAADKAVTDYLGAKSDIPFVSQDGFGLRRKRKRSQKKKKKGPSAKRRKTINKSRTSRKKRRVTKRTRRRRRCRSRSSDIYS